MTRWIRKSCAAVAALALAATMGVAGSAGAALITRPIVKDQTVPPFGCDLTKLQYVIDTPFSATWIIPPTGLALDNCNGFGKLFGPGWLGRAGWPGVVGTTYAYTTFTKEIGTEHADWLPTITEAGNYEVWISNFHSENRTTDSQFTVYADDGNAYLFHVNEKTLPDLGHTTMLGNFYFKRHPKTETTRTTGYVTMKNVTRGTSDSVDAAFFKYLGPVPPTAVNADDAKHTDSIVVRWSAVESARKYQIFRGLSPNPATAIRIATVVAPARSYTDTPLDENKTYYYFVKTIGALAKISAFSKGNVGSTGVTPAVPTDVSATDAAFADKIVVTWTAVSGATSYKIYRGTTNVAADATLLGTSTTATFEDTGLAAASTYWYFVTAVNAIAESARSVGDDGSTQ